MKPAEVIIIREIIKESYPYQKKDNEQRGDEVWYMLLKDYDFEPMHEALINYIKQGNKFIPSIAQLIELYNSSHEEAVSGVLELMADDGYFDDSDDTSTEWARWNRNNRIKKAKVWVENSNGPHWFKNAYASYYKKMYPNRSNVITNPKTKKIEYKERGENGA